VSAANARERAAIISNALFLAGVAAVVLVLADGTTWASDGIWAPGGAYSRFIAPAIGLVWITVISGLLVTRSPSTARARAGVGAGAVADPMPHPQEAAQGDDCGRRWYDLRPVPRRRAGLMGFNAFW
jgi:hypothetical protein